MLASNLKLSKFISVYKPLFFLINKLKYFILYPLHLGGPDYYPAFRSIKKNLLNKFFFKNDLERINFWSIACKKHKTLRFFYSNQPEQEFKANTLLDENSIYYKPIQNFYRDGVSTIENFFNINELNFIKKIFLEKVDPKLNKNLKSSWFSSSRELNNLISKKVAPIEKELFDKKIGKQKYVLAAFKKKTEQKSSFKSSVFFHQDRFIPAIKLIYFPTDVEIDPFEYYSKSHIINDIFFKNVQTYFNSNDYTVASKNYDYKNYKLKQFKVKANTLIIAATHGLHRRGQTEDQSVAGIRRFITISYYKKFTRYDLLKALFFNKIFSF